MALLAGDARGGFCSSVGCSPFILISFWLCQIRVRYENAAREDGVALRIVRIGWCEAGIAQMYVPLAWTLAWMLESTDVSEAGDG